MPNDPQVELVVPRNRRERRAVRAIEAGKGIDPTVPLTVTVARARELSGLGNTLLYVLMNSGRLKSVLVGRRRLILYESLKALLTTGASE